MLAKVGFVLHHFDYNGFDRIYSVLVYDRWCCYSSSSFCCCCCSWFLSYSFFLNFILHLIGNVCCVIHIQFAKNSEWAYTHTPHDKMLLHAIQTHQTSIIILGNGTNKENWQKPKKSLLWLLINFFFVLFYFVIVGRLVDWSIGRYWIGVWWRQGFCRA